MAGSEVPSVSAGQLGPLLACPRRLRLTLTPEERPRNPANDAAFRLSRAVTEALRAAHETAEARDTSLDAALVRTPPPDLGHEERQRFADALEHYVDAFDEQPWRLDGPPDGRYGAPAQGGRFRLTGWAQLVFRDPTAPPDEPRLAVRRIHLRPAPADAGTRDDPVADVALAALVRRGLPGTPSVEIEHLWTVRPVQLASRTITASAVAELRTRLDEATRQALHGRADPQPGWWCSGCLSLKGCPAIPQETALRRPPTAPRPPATRAPDPTLGAPVQPAPGALVLSPTRYRLFESCPRRYYLAHVLQLGGDPDDPQLLDGTPGIAAHDELHARHADGFARHDQPGQVHDDAAPDLSVARAARAHALLCPRDQASYLGGEVDLRFLIAGKAVLLTGRADALWRYPDGTLEVRDYKTGHCPLSLDDDLPAALYALLAHHHPSRPARVRVVYESLGAETPHTVELAVTPHVLQRAFAQVVGFADRLRSERSFPAHPQVAACRTCPYRALCPHAITP